VSSEPLLSLVVDRDRGGLRAGSARRLFAQQGFGVDCAAEREPVLRSGQNEDPVQVVASDQRQPPSSARFRSGRTPLGSMNDSPRRSIAEMDEAGREQLRDLLAQLRAGSEIEPPPGLSGQLPGHELHAERLRAGTGIDQHRGRRVPRGFRPALGEWKGVIPGRSQRNLPSMLTATNVSQQRAGSQDPHVR
jgi:hypothetical protein